MSGGDAVRGDIGLDEESFKHPRRRAGRLLRWCCMLRELRRVVGYSAAGMLPVTFAMTEALTTAEKLAIVATVGTATV